MTQSELLTLHEGMTSAARALMQNKNHDYSGASGKSPFRNLQACEALGITPTEKGILVRITDKLARLAAFADAGEFKVKDESVQDTCLDLINYAVLLRGYLIEKTQNAPVIPSTQN